MPQINMWEKVKSMKTAKDFPSSLKTHLIGLVISILQNYFRQIYKAFSACAICGTNLTPVKLLSLLFFTDSSFKNLTKTL